MKHAHRTWVLAAGALVVVMLAAAVEAAPPPPAAAEAVSVAVLGIRATKESKPQTDPALQSVADELRMTKFNSFRLIVSDTRQVRVGGGMDVSLVEDYALHVEVEKASPESTQIVLVWMRVEKDAQGKPQARPLKRVQMTIRKGKFFLSGGWELKDGAALFGAVAVK